MPAREIKANSGDVLAVLGQEVWHGAGGKLLVIAVVLPAIARLETTRWSVTGLSRARTSSRSRRSLCAARGRGLISANLGDMKRAQQTTTPEPVPAR
jgi:hypothetical protein